MADLGTFSKRITARGVAIEKRVTKSVNQLAVDIAQSVIIATPVDTGRARGNWEVSLSHPSDAVKDDARDRSGQAAVAAARAIVAQRDEPSDIWVQNNLPYIKKLDQGHSSQAPKNFVRKAVGAAVEAFRRRKIVD